MNLTTAQVKSKFEMAEVFRMVDLVAYHEGSIVSRTIINDNSGTVTLFGFDQAQELSEHTSPYNALVHVLEGEVEITISGKPMKVAAGELVLMPADEPHKLTAITRFKMLLTMIRSN